MPPLLKKVIFSLVALSLITLSIEGILRLTGFRPKLIPFIVFAGNPERSLAEKGENYSGRKDTIYLTDNVTFWKFKPSSEINPDPNQKIWKFYSSYRINSRGFRGDEFSAARQSYSLRIIAVGDSITFGLLVPEKKAYHKLLEEKLNQTFAPLKVEVITAGIPGYTSYQGRQLLKQELLSYSPDLVIVYFGGNNEFARSYYTDRDYANYIRESPTQKWSQKSLALGLLASAVQKIKAPIPTPPLNLNQDKLRVPVSDFMDDLTEIASLVIRSGSIPILVVPPHSNKNLEMQPIAEEYSSMVRSLGNFTSIADVDLQFKQQDSDKLFAEDYFHPNEAGHKVIAEIIYEVAAEEIREKLIRSGQYQVKP